VDIHDITDGKRSRRRRTLRDDSVGDVFGIELDDEAPPAPKPKSKLRKFKPTGAAVRKLRKKSGLSRADFAREVGVSALSISNWEKTKGALKLKARSFQGLEKLHNQNA